MGLKVVIDQGAYAPERAHDLDAGYDLRSPVEGIVCAHDSLIINTGVHVMIPEECAGILVSKSGLNVRNDITSTGLIDEGYTGAIVVKLYNHGNEDYHVHRGDKISQLVILPIITPEIELVEELPQTERGADGFGSTGR